MPYVMHLNKQKVSVARKVLGNRHLRNNRRVKLTTYCNATHW